jgi:hypothetical protein
MYLETLATHGFSIVSRQNLGSDFGAYKLGFKLLFELKNYNQITDIVITNDSMVTTPESAKVLKFVGDRSAGCNCLFYHYQGVPHAGSMLIRFDQNIILHKTFINFWKTYYPYVTKRKIIKKGEHILSKICGEYLFQTLCKF